jgi:hypothetical protein
MSKYKKEKADSMNQLLKKREPTPPKQEEPFKQFVVSQVVTPL